MVSVGGIGVAQSCAAHAVIITVVATIARSIKIKGSLSGFGAICSPRCQIDVGLAHLSRLESAIDVIYVTIFRFYFYCPKPAVEGSAQWKSCGSKSLNIE